MIPELYGEYRPDAVTGGKWKATGKSDEVSLEIARNKARGPEMSWSFFHPGRVDVRLAPDWFRRELKGIDERLEVCWHPVYERWVCWFKEPTVTFWMCAGWKRLFIIQYPDGSYMPLDERTLGEAWSRNPKLYNYKGRQFFERVVIEAMRDKMKKETREHEDLVEQRAKEQWDYALIKNIGSGSKFADHDNGA